MAIGIQLSALKPGDIIVDRAAGGACHSLVVVEAGNDPDVVHVAPAQIIREPLSTAQAQGGELFAYRMKHNQTLDVNDVRQRMVDMAIAWSVTPTVYASFPSNVELAGSNRFQGTREARVNGQNPPFGYDALFRIFKWAEKARLGQAFSANRGTTCCAFLMSTYQTACMESYLRAWSFDQQITQKMFTSLRDQRGPLIDRGVGQVKTDPRTQQAQTYYANQGLRATSNLGATGPVTNYIVQHGINGVWKALVKKKMNLDANVVPDLSVLLTPALYSDVKYSAATLMHGVFTALNSGWKAL